MATLTFRKRERMMRRRLIDDLFGGGDSCSLVAFPLRAVYKLHDRNPEDAPLQMLVSVPKKHFRHAVDRNRVKRQVREMWRLHKSLLAETLAADKQLLVAFVWLSGQHLATRAVEERMVSLVHRIAERL
jgi:ribonuclease P protein component